MCSTDTPRSRRQSELSRQLIRGHRRAGLGRGRLRTAQTVSTSRAVPEFAAFTGKGEASAIPFDLIKSDVKA